MSSKALLPNRYAMFFMSAIHDDHHTSTWRVKDHGFIPN